MQHRTQGKGLAFDHLIVVACELDFRILKVLKQKITVQYERVSLVPCFVHAGPPVWSAVFVFSKVSVVSPDGVIRSYDICTSHYLYHLHRERSAIEHIAVEFDIDSVKVLDESRLFRQQVILGNFVVWLHPEPSIARGQEKRHSHYVCKYISHKSLLFRMLHLKTWSRSSQTDSRFLARHALM